jgi:hypothetical protein
MKILKAKYENGQIKLTEPAPEPGPVDVEVVFLDRDDRRWDEIIRDAGSRPGLCAEADQVLEDYRTGKTAPLTLKNSEQPNAPSLLGPIS